MTYDWDHSSLNGRAFVFNLVSEMKQIIYDNFIVFYLHN